jgi:DNA-binding NtrC family response regulator
VKNQEWNKTMFSDAIILVAGAEPNDREIILQALGDQCHVVAAQSIDDALAHVSDSVDLVICEGKAGPFNGLDLLRRWKSSHSQTPFIVMVDGRDVSAAVEAMKQGAADCIVKPLDADELRAAATHLLSLHGGTERSETDRNGSNGTRRSSNIEIPPDTSLEDLERAAVEQALVQHRGNRTHAARTLGISVRTLQRKLKAWGMPVISFPSAALGNNFGLAGSTHGYDVQAH